MDDFRTQLTAVIDHLRSEGKEPVFLVVDLIGIEQLKSQSPQSVTNFRQSAVDALVSAGQGCDAFTYDDHRIVAILTGFDRLKTFAAIEKLRRALPIMAQSYDCTLTPGFDVLEYDDEQGVAGLMKQLVAKRSEDSAA